MKKLLNFNLNKIFYLNNIINIVFILQRFIIINYYAIINNIRPYRPIYIYNILFYFIKFTKFNIEFLRFLITFSKR